MYTHFYGFSALPFSPHPDAECFYLGQHHRQALHLLEYGCLHQAGCMVITGDVGTGKTTVIRHFLNTQNNDMTIGILNAHTPTTGHLLHWIAIELGFYQAGQALEETYDAFVAFLLAHYAQGKRTLLIIEEAHGLSLEALEELRILLNINTGKDLLVSIFLIGQLDLLEKLNRPELRSFTQRVSIHAHLHPLTETETSAYIRYRLNKVGGNPALVDEATCSAIHLSTGGIPRLINLLCDRILVNAFSEDQARLNVEHAHQALADLSLYGLKLFPIPSPQKSLLKQSSV
jgi:general secretion pathway protein A